MVQTLFPVPPRSFQLPKGFWSYLINGTAALAAAVSALFSASSAESARQTIRQQQESLLLTERVNACVTVRNLADEVEGAYRATLPFHPRQNLRPPGTSPRQARSMWFDRTATLSGALRNFRSAERLELLGPHPLAQAEANLEHALSELVGVAADEQKTYAQFVPYESALMQAEAELHVACVRSVGAYREGPRETIPPLIDRPWLFEKSK